MQTNSKNLTPVLKWPGGKTGELPIIRAHMPMHFEAYFEPFVGGGAVFLTIPSNIPAFVNDISQDLINLYKNISSQNPAFFQLLNKFASSWTDLQSLVETNSDLLLREYMKFRENYYTEFEYREQLHAFVDENRAILINCLAPECPYDTNHFIKDAKRSLTSKTKRMRKLEQRKGTLSREDVLRNIEGAVKSAFYTHLRYLYNYPEKHAIPDAQQAAIFFFVRENAYASMFRFNKHGKFNIPYGGISYNRKDLTIKVSKMRDPALIERFRNANFGNVDFIEFLRHHPPRAKDFVFLDPPYDTDFSEYDQNKFGKEDQQRLADYLLNECSANFILVIKATDFIWSLYEHRGLKIIAFDKKYMYTVKERNNRDTVHLLIRNYSEG